LKKEMLEIVLGAGTVGLGFGDKGTGKVWFFEKINFFRF